jgi:predicted oxidoreductase (fatty acid repression mutant protein)
MEFFESVKNRRSIYGIGNELSIPDEKLEKVIRDAVRHVPSAFNSQGGRAVLLLGDNHKALWNITMEALRRIVPPDAFGQTEERINSFASGYGTVLFFEDQSVVESLQKQFPLYKDNFPIWSLQSDGMLQYIIWTALEMEGLGASLQHYNPLIDVEVHKRWSIPENWRLLGEMPFGNVTAPAGEKEFKPLDERVKVFK